MRRQICIATSSLHVLALAICTYIAAIEIESIIFTGLICSLTGLAAGIAALRYRRFWLAAAGFLTLIIAMLLFILEAFFLELGPEVAALPFCIIFIVNQTVATLIILVELNALLATSGTPGWQISMKTLVIVMISSSVFFAVVRHLLERPHNGLMVAALSLLGVTFVGLSAALHTAYANRGAKCV
jgi:hypothetical protein